MIYLFKNFFSLFILFISINSWSIDELGGEKLAFFPLVQANPVLDLAIGGGASYLYKFDNLSRVSQLQALAAYSTNNSYYGVLINRNYFDQNNQRTNTFLAYGHINYDWNVAGLSSSTKLAQNSVFALHRHMFRVSSLSDSFFIGPTISYANVSFQGSNSAGNQVITFRNLEDDDYLSLGFAGNYDTRDNYYFPYSGHFLEFTYFASIAGLVSDDSFGVGLINYRYYKKLENKDVMVPNLYLKYSSKTTPSSFMSKEGSQNQLRGFNGGDFYNRNMYNFNFEYRKYLTDVWKIVGFVGVSYLAGDAEILTADGYDTIKEDYYSDIGLGFRYALQPKNRVHFRFDYAYTNTADHAFYMGVQEAF